CGPRAAEVLAARFGSGAQPGPMVALDRVGFVARPDWLSDEMLLSVSETLSPWLSDEVGILDEPTAFRLRDGLQATPWVREVRVERAFPDRFRLHLELRRPRLSVHAADDLPLCLVDEDGCMLPWMRTTLPRVRLYREGGRPTMDVRHGQPADDRRVRVAAMVVAEWRDEIAPLVPDCPRLLEVDATNLDEGWIVGVQYPEVRVVLERRDGAPVSFMFGRPPDSRLPRVPAATKANVLRSVLERYPGLDGLVAGDLRLSRRWADYLQPREPGVPDPIGPWSELDDGQPVSVEDEGR
ncbi:MAG: FtsQ-type POTRA domain-containing protein, partial [Planctomycetes bacterium]|nr:FtsQ-type POTRA domain-containing protein [Planctomycetota bacterium]